MSEPSENGSGLCSLARPLRPAHSTLQVLYAEPLCLTTSEDVPVWATGQQHGSQVVVVHMELAHTGSTIARRTHVQRVGDPRRVMGMLFQGPVQVAEYTWPLVVPSNSSSGGSTHVTAAMVLPELQRPGVLQLVLSEQTYVGTSSDPGGSSSGSGAGQAGWVSSAAFARLPLLFLPRAAVQEVETLLVPAMRQEAAADAAAAAATGFGSVPSVPDGQQVSTAVWRHWRALVDDMHAVLELSTHLNQVSAFGPVYSSSTSSSVNTALTTTLRQAAVQQQVLPVVLGFLQQQGLHQCCAALVRQLPPAMAAAWQQQTTGSTGWESVLLPVQEDAQQRQQQQQQQQEEEEEEQHIGCSDAGVKALPSPPHKQGSGAGGSSRRVTGSTAAHSVTAASSSRTPHQQGAAGVTAPAGSSASLVPSSSSCSPGSSSCPAGAGSSHQASLPRVTWVTPWRLFPGDLEQQYLQYKHTTYLWLDRYVAAFTALYMIALVVRMVVERDVAGTAFYLYYIACKCLPYISLWRGQLDVFFRDRERLITWNVQWLCMMPILFKALCCDSHITPALQHALHRVCASWWQLWRQLQSLQALAHLPWLLVSSGLGPRLTRAVQQRVAAAAAAAWRQASGVTLVPPSGVCRLFMLPESPMRAFWKLKGELLVIGLMPIPQNVRLRWHVPSITLEVLAMAYTFALLFDWRQVVARYTASLCLSICASWCWDYNIRSRFRGHLLQQAAARAAALARKQQQLQGFEG